MGITISRAAKMYDVRIRARFPNRDVSFWGQPTQIEIGPPPVLTRTGGVLKWTAVNAETECELWIDYGGGDAAAKGRIIHQTLFGTEFQLPTALPRGRYTAWVRALRSETGDLYRGRWSTAFVDSG